MIGYALLRPFIFLLDAERAHRLSLYGVRLLPSLSSGSDDPILASRVAGLNFPNPVGLAAGYDKDAEVPVQMHQRAGGTPSAMRFKLIYHYVRVMFTMFTRASRRRAPAPDSSTVEARAAKLSEGGQSA